jgi:hypothetical protein
MNALLPKFEVPRKQGGASRSLIIFFRYILYKLFYKYLFLDNITILIPIITIIKMIIPHSLRVGIGACTGALETTNPSQVISPA